ncbi:MAG: tetratricopeptide repeat protein [Thermodesulfobacteriota bacterium]
MGEQPTGTTQGKTGTGIDKRTWLSCVFLILISILAYWNVKDNGYVFDDSIYVTENEHVKEGLTLQNIKWAFGLEGFDHWIPITWLSLMLDSHLSGINSKWQHLTNALFHIVNVLFLFCFLNFTTRSPLKSLLVAALFAVHPLNVESVAWISERKNVLSTFFWMLCLLTYAKYSYSKNRRWRWYLITLCLFGLGLMSKSMLVTLPFVFLLLDYWPLDRIQMKDTRTKSMTGINHLLVEKIPFFLLSFCSIYVISRSLEGLGGFYTTVPLNLRILNAIVSYIAYFRKLILPIHLACFYPFPEEIALWKVLGSGLILIVVSLAAIKNMKKYKYVIVGWLWYLGTLIPAIGIKQIGLWGAIADRHAYVPQTGIFIIFIWLGFDLADKWKQGKVVFTAIAFSIIMIFGVLTSTQVKRWKNNFALFGHPLTLPNKAYQSLGFACLTMGNLDEAVTHFAQALKLNPNSAATHYNFGLALKRIGKIDEAENHFRLARQLELELKPKL